MKKKDQHCKKSITILEECCRNFFNNIESNRFLYFPDSNNSSINNLNNKSTIDIIFFGGLIKRLSELHQWKFNKARLWVLSSVYKKILIEIFKIPPQSIGVIPRYKLFPVNKDICNFEMSTNPIRLVYAGRISTVKNIESLLRLVSYLQSHYQLNISLNLYGSFDNEINLSCRPQFRKQFKQHIDGLLAALPWNSLPIFHGECKENEWINEVPKNSIFISLSKYFQEDFGVSIAQWQGSGQPLIISNWGGHQDVCGNNVMKISPNLIAESDDPLHIKTTLTRQLAKYLTQELNQLTNYTSPSYLTEPIPCSIEKLKSTSLNFRQDLGCAVRYLDLNQWDMLCTSKTGQNLLLNLNELFTPKSKPTDNIIISNWFNSDCRQETSHVPFFCEQILPKIEQFEFIYFRDIHLPINTKKLFLAKTIYFPYFINEMESTITKLTKTLDIAATVSIFLPPSQKHQFKKIKSMLRPCDQIQLYKQASLVIES